MSVHLFSHQPEHRVARPVENPNPSIDKVTELGLSIWRTDPNHPFFHGEYEATGWDGTVYSQICHCRADGKECDKDQKAEIISTQWNFGDERDASQSFSMQTLNEIDQLLDAPEKPVCPEYADGKESEEQPFSMQTLIQEIDQLIHGPLKPE